VWVSVAVQEWIPLHDLGCYPLCTWKYTYNFNHTYPVVTSSTASSSTATSTGGTTTVTNPVTTSPTTTPTPTGTTTQPSATTTVTQTVTVTAPTTTVAAPITLVINVPSTITIQQAGAFIYITITSNDRRSLQTLCWRDASKTKQTCSRSHGVWRVKLRKTPGKRVFLLKENGKVVARKTVSIKLKS